MSEKNSSVFLVLAEPDYGLSEAYSSFFEEKGWDVDRAKGLKNAKFAETLTIIDFRIAAANPKPAMVAPLNRVAYDFHYDPSYGESILEHPFHILDNTTVIVHDLEARWFIKKVIRPVNTRILMFPYPTDSFTARFVEGTPATYSPKIYSSHPWLEGQAVHWIMDDLPKVATKNSRLVIPAYNPVMWKSVRWAAKSGLAIVAPGLESFERTLMSAALLFDPESRTDFERKLLMLQRPAIDLSHKVKLTVGVVVPLYKKDAPGGAENHAGGLARAFNDAGHEARVLTTRTDSMLDWNNNLPEGIENIDGLPVERFSTSNVDSDAHHAISHRVNMRDNLSYHELTEWMRTNIRSRAMERIFSEGNEFDALFFMPYLYGTTFWGSQMSPERSFLIPCYHDEPVAYSKVVRQNALFCAGLFLNTYAEKRLAESALSIANPFMPVVGEGVSTNVKGNAERFRKKFSINRNFVLYVGRMQREKNVPQLLEYHQEFVQSTGKKVSLVLAGKGDMKIEDDSASGIRYLGFLSEQDKRDAFAACSAFALPSTQESFSIVMMEAWAQGRPVIANGKCNVSREHLFSCQGGLLYHNQSEYASAVVNILGDPTQATKTGRKGQQYVRDNFTWQKVIERIEAVFKSTKLQPLSKRLGEAAKKQSGSLDFGGTTAFSLWADGAPDRANNVSSGYDLPLPQLLDLAEDASDVSVEYKEFSNRAVIGSVFSKTRGAITQHLRTNYLEPLEKNQSFYNRLIAEALRRFFEK